MAKLKFGWKIWVLIFALVLSILAINPFLTLNKGVVVVEVLENSTAEASGLKTGEIIKEINGIKINSMDDYVNAIDVVFGKVKNEKENEKVKAVKVSVKTSKEEYVFLAEKPDFSVKSLPMTRLKLGLELQGGSRALLKPEEKVSQQTLDNIQNTMSNRLNNYGIKDVKVSQQKDLEGNGYILVEIAGTSPKELKELVLSQGKFEAKIGNETVFVGGGKDITSVCQSAECSGIINCEKIGEGEYCKFQFAVYLSKDAAKRHAEITSKLSINISQPEYLNETLDLYLDDKKVDSLLISVDLKGKETTQVAVSGSGFGSDRTEAYENAFSNMKKLQTILITGGLPVKLSLEKLDSVSALLGKEILRNIIITFFVIAIGVSIILFIRYRNVKFFLPTLIVMFSEIIIILGVAAAINWNLDLASIAGILITLGTCVDAQIIILDETQLGIKYSLRERMKRAFAIILGSFATTTIAMLPLLRAGTGLLKGFAFTTIIGLVIGVFITRPAFNEIISKLKGIE